MIVSEIDSTAVSHDPESVKLREPYVENGNVGMIATDLDECILAVDRFLYVVKANAA